MMKEQTDEPTPSDADLQLAHTVFVHVVDEAFTSLLIAIEECNLIDDSRAQDLIAKLRVIAEELMVVSDDIMDTIPGVMSREEAEEIVTEALERAALLKGFRADSLKPDTEVLH